VNAPAPLLALALALAAAAPALAQPLEARTPPPELRADRLYDFPQVAELLQGYARAYPDWVRVESVGKSGQGRDLWLVTVRNPAGPPELQRPAIYVDGNTHANEVQGAEACLYLLDTLLKGYGRLPRVTELLDRVVFHVLPVVNPDGRVAWFQAPSTAHFPRTVMRPVDDDRDGLADEDGYDDLNGDGVLTTMRKRVPLGEGTHKLDPRDPRLLVPVKEGEPGDWIRLGWEGVDDDGDGRVNEDPVGYVDPNRTFGFDWQPRYVQRGSSAYPLQIPETRAIAAWALDHPNVGAVQSFHNAGRMILRGPGSKGAPAYPASDLRVYDAIGKEGERLLPGYRYLVIHEDLYRVHGSTVDHFYMLHGAISLTNELYRAPSDLDGDGRASGEERLKFNDLLTLGRQFVPWEEVEHPQYGTVEVGGYRQDVGRVPEPWMQSDESHRNAAFVLYHAWELPKLRLGEPRVRALGDGVFRVDVTVFNERLIPSVSAIARQNRLHRLDLLRTQGAEVIAAGVVQDRYLDQVRLQRHRPQRLEVEGVPGRGHVRLMVVVKGQGPLTLAYESVKGGRVVAEVPLEE
jgi:hypothetical protein